MELKIYFQSIKRGWWIILLTLLAAVNIGIVMLLTSQPVYSVNAKFIISPNVDLISSQRELVDSLDTLDKRSIISTYAEILKSNVIVSQTITSLKLAENIVDDYFINVVPLPDTNVLELTIEGPDAKVAAAIANKNGQFAIVYMNERYPVYQIDFVDFARPTSEPISPQPVRDLGLALIFGLLGGIVLAIVREQLSTSIDSLRMRSIMDNVSGVYNQQHFLKLLRQHVSTKPNENLSLGLIKLTGLDEVLPVLPQSLEKRILQQSTQVLKEQLRGNDIVGRWDESTFAVFLPNTPDQAAQATFERIKDFLETSYQANGDEMAIDLAPHVGITVLKNSEPVNELIDRVSQALEMALDLESQIKMF